MLEKVSTAVFASGVGAGEGHLLPGHAFGLWHDDISSDGEMQETTALTLSLNLAVTPEYWMFWCSLIYADGTFS